MFQILVKTYQHCYQEQQKQAQSPMTESYVCCHRFDNVREIFQGDPHRALPVGMASQDIEPLPFCCSTRRTGVCDCNNMHWSSKAAWVHKIKCNLTKQEKCAQRTPDKSPKLWWNDTLVKPKGWTCLERNQTCRINALHHNSLIQILV